jgi:predicted MFS family arabinose efflux permease
MAARPAIETLVTQPFIWILAAGGFASTFSGRAVEPMIALIARDLTAPFESVALLAPAFALPFAFIQLILGPIGDALGKERVMKVCAVLLTITLVGCALAPDLSLLVVLRVVGGMTAGGVIPLAIALVGDRVPIAGRQVAISRLLIAIISGQLAGSSLAGILALAIGWRGVFWLSAAMMAVASVFTMVGFRATPAGSPLDLHEALRRYRGILLNPRARALFLFVFLEAIAIFSIGPYLAGLFEARAAGGAAEAGIALGGFAIGGLAYSALVQWLLRTLGLSRMLVLGGLLSATALLVLGLAGPWHVDAAAMAVLGTGFYMLHNSFQTQVTEIAPEARASAVALHAFSFFGGQALGVVLFGAGLGSVGLFPSLAAAAVLIMGVGVASARVLSRPLPARTG